MEAPSADTWGRSNERFDGPKGACGPGCPSLAVVYVDDFYGASDTQVQPAPCPRCGRPAIVIRIVYDANFYNNAHFFEGT